MKDKLYKKLFGEIKGPMLAALIDPDCYSREMLNVISRKDGAPDFVLVGGSHVSELPAKCVAEIKKVTGLPVLLFPGNPVQVCPGADAVLMLLLISGRNPEYLIGHHVTAAPVIKKYGLETIPMGYILAGDHAGTSVSYITQTLPIPAGKTEMIVATAMAGEMTGSRLIYLEAGSGAGIPLPAETVAAVRKSITVPLFSGGGILRPATAVAHWKAGADVVVVGTVFEKNPTVLREFVKARNKIR
jgi:putative glycerol-1-phosphate prenyltransferase